MSEDLTFWMGKYEARFPADRLYCKTHMWLLPLAETPDAYRVGFTTYSVRLLRDVYFLDWGIDAGTAVRHREEIGEIESSKAVSSLYAPSAGTIVAFNELLLTDPSAVNLDNYASGWLFEFRSAGPFLSPPEYLAHVQVGWDVTQRLIKGQMNEG